MSDQPRYLDLERQLAEHAGRRAGQLDRALELLDLAQARAVGMTLRDFPRREWGRERAEECADSLNYAAWDLLSLTVTDRSDDAAGVARELLAVHAVHLVRAFDASQRARDILGR